MNKFFIALGVCAAATEIKKLRANGINQSLSLVTEENPGLDIALGVLGLCSLVILGGRSIFKRKVGPSNE
jgi:hypothetical protein